eukprot:4774459-Amphidinium_carterae.1
MAMIAYDQPIIGYHAYVCYNLNYVNDDNRVVLKVDLQAAQLLGPVEVAAVAAAAQPAVLAAKDFKVDLRAAQLVLAADLAAPAVVVEAVVAATAARLTMIVNQ